MSKGENETHKNDVIAPPYCPDTDKVFMLLHAQATH